MATVAPSHGSGGDARRLLGTAALALAVAVAVLGLRSAPPSPAGGAERRMAPATDAPPAAAGAAADAPDSLVGLLAEGFSTAAIHEVAGGETASGIAATYGITVEELAEVNGLPTADALAVGQHLVIPQHPAE